MEFAKYAAKAFVGSLTALLGALLAVLTGDETLAAVTTREWIWIASEALAVFGVIYAVPNKPKGAHEAP
jgi:hypothetical protein